MMRLMMFLATLAVADAVAAPVTQHNASVRENFVRRASQEKVRVIHGSGGGWDADTDRRMMAPYWQAQETGVGPLLRINTNSGPGEVDNATEAIFEKLQLEFETVPGLEGEECMASAFDETLVERIDNSAGIWFGGGLPGRAVSCLFGYSATQFGVNTPPERTTPLLEALRRHPLVGGISAGAMMQPSAPLLHGNEISYRPRGFHESADIMRIGELLMNNQGAGFIADSFTIHSHFSERGYQGMLPIAVVQRPGLRWAAGFDEGGVGHYFEATGELFTVGVPSRGTGIALYSDCVGNIDQQECYLHFVSDGDVWNARTGAFSMDGAKQLCTGQHQVPEGSNCVFNRAQADNQNFRRISKMAAAAPVGSVIENYHTGPGSDITVGVTFTVTETTQAWCNSDGVVVSFTNLGLSQTRSPDVSERRRQRCGSGPDFDGF